MSLGIPYMGSKRKLSHVEYENLEPIPLTEEWLVKCPQFKFNPKVILTRQYVATIGRGRKLSISDVGNPNLTVWLLNEEAPKVTDVICLHNFDYDGKLYVHQLQNLYFALTGEKMEVAP